MTVKFLSPNPKFQAFDANGNPLSGGKLYSFAAGSATPLATYTDSTGIAANPNPVILDASGEANVWLSSESYKLVLKNSANVQQWSVDNITGIGFIPGNNIIYWGGTSGGSANAQTIITDPDFIAYDVPLFIGFIAGFDNTGAMTINANGIGAIAIYKEGVTGPDPLAGGEIIAGNVYIIAFDGTEFQIVSSSASSRTALTNDTNFYIATTGSDTNDGRSSMTPWLTWQHAASTIENSLDLNGFNATVNIADGAYAAGMELSGGLLGAGNLIFQGNTTTPANVTLTTTDDCIYVHNSSQLTLKGCTLSSSAGSALTVGQNAILSFESVVFGTCAESHINEVGLSQVSSTGDYSITGGAKKHFSLIENSNFNGGTSIVTITGTPAFTTDFCFADSSSSVVAGGMTFTGSATGKRFDVLFCANVNVDGNGINFFPGDAPGTTENGGIYDGLASASLNQFNKSVITSSGTFTTSANITTSTVFKITITGGGGGGGGGNTSTPASGGSAAGTAIKWATGLTPSTAYNVVIGAGGATNVDGNDSTIVIGATTYTGGKGFLGLCGTSPQSGVAGGTATNGDINLFGGGSSSAGTGPATTGIGTDGGASYWGGGGNGVINGTAGNGPSPGSGGGGGGGDSGFQGTGGSGANGICLIEWVE